MDKLCKVEQVSEMIGGEGLICKVEQVSGTIGGEGLTWPEDCMRRYQKHVDKLWTRWSR